MSKKTSPKHLKYSVVEIGAEDKDNSPIMFILEAVDAAKKVFGVKLIVNYDPICQVTDSEAYPSDYDHLIYLSNRKMTRDEMDKAFKKHQGVTREEYMEEGYQ